MAQAARKRLRVEQPITKSRVKRATADALRRLKFEGAERLSNPDLADTLGCSEATIRNRLDDDDQENQLTAYELMRLVGEHGVEAGSDIVGRVIPGLSFTYAEPQADPTQLIDGMGAAIGPMFHGWQDRDWSPAEARALLPGLEMVQREASALVAHLRTVLSR